uniref:Uncharacterized protein n=1 Tax=Romanomermis culicivorax TaxID=13658 RepID=A0A915K2K9_ROMCU
MDAKLGHNLLNSVKTKDIRTPSVALLSLPKNVSTSYINEHVIDVGCNSLKYSWCADGYGMTREPIGLYLSTFFLLASGFPLANCALSALFSKVLGPRRQGTMQGNIIAGGAAARTSGPLFINFTFDLFGPRVSWGLSAGILVISIVLALFFYKRLVALDTNRNLKAGQSFEYKTGVVIKF